MAIGGFILSMNHQTSVKSTALNLIPGVVWGIGNLFMFYSQPKSGCSYKFLIITITCDRIYIRWDFYFRREKDRRQMIGIWSGIVVIIIASIILGNLK